MNIKIELLKKKFMDYIDNQFDDFEFDTNEIVDTVAVNMLSEIQDIIINENYSDFDVIEEIVCIFEKYGIDFGTRHDF